MNLCTCAHPRLIGTNRCDRCYKIVTQDSPARPPSAGAGSGCEAGAGRPSTPAPATLDPWEVDPTDLVVTYPYFDDDDYMETWNQTEGARIKAAFEKRDGRA